MDKYITILRKIFLVVGHKEKDMQTLISAFLVGMEGEMDEIPGYKEMSAQLQNLRNSYRSDADLLIGIREILKNNEYMEIFDHGFKSYLKKYCDAVFPSIGVEKRGKIGDLVATL